MAGGWVNQALLQLAGHDEFCSYVSSSNGSDSNGTVTATWVVNCPDGRQTFSADASTVRLNAAGFLPVRSLAGGLFGVDPVSAVVGNYTLWYMALPGIAATVAVLVTAIVTPRRPENSPMSAAEDPNAP